MRQVLPILALSLPAAAQLTVIPSAVQTTQPTRSPFYTANTFYSTTTGTVAPASRSQVVVDCADIAAPGAVWTSLAVRRPVGLTNDNPAMITNVTIILSVSPSPWQSVTSTFASNHGPNQVTVLSGSISLPAAPGAGATWPAPWQPPLPFTVPFAYGTVPGGSLVIDIHQDQGANRTGTPWYVEYSSPVTGGRVSNGNAQSTCRFSGGTYNNSLSYTTAGLGGNGGTWYLTYGGLQPNLIGLGAIGGNGAGGTWLGIPLPIDLAAIGAPGCRWSVSMAITVGLATGTTTSARWPNITVPADPAMRGSAFYDHAVFADPAANPAGLVTTWSSRWNIGGANGAPAAYVSATGNSNAAATGTLVSGAAITLQLQ
jgi:hypothetical protein